MEDFFTDHDEQWVELKMDNFDPKSKFEISDYGRVKSYAVVKKGRILKSHLVDGYPAISFRMKNGKSTVKYLHKLVAIHFIENNDKKKNKVIHLDFDKANNRKENLKWVNKKELDAHLTKNPNKKIIYGRRHYAKLTETQVIRLKKRIFDPNRKTRLKILAKEFGISEMQLYRIKRGENWGTVKK